MILSGRPTFTNVIPKIKSKHITPINNTMIINKDIIKVKKDGTPVYNYSLNTDFWKSTPKPCDVILDEAHNILSARQTMSKQNRILGQWLALLRRVIGGSSGQHGELILIMQIGRQLDVVAREMSTQVQYHIMYSRMICQKCGLMWQRSSQDPEQLKVCPKCKNWKFSEDSHRVMVMKFADYNKFDLWKEYGMKTYYKHYMIWDIADYFPYYDTQQWENMFDTVYE